MKTLTLIAILCSLSVGLSAQTSKLIEADFSKVFKQRDYWVEHSSENTNNNGLANVNRQIEKKLKYYTQKSPAELENAFKNIGGIVSGDGLFRILSWDTMTGGSQHLFENIIQYKWAGRVVSIIDTIKTDDDYVFSYNDIFTLKVGTENYYLATYYGIFGLHERGEGIRVFAMQNGRLNDKVKLIKTKSGLTYKLYYTYNQTLTNSDVMSETTIGYDPDEKTITFPVVIDDGKITENSITYKFNGQYFEKVKS